jgi:hypothetical protein
MEYLLLRSGISFWELLADRSDCDDDVTCRTCAALLRKHPRPRWLSIEEWAVHG